ncbi:MAG: TonB-dependent receptor plug domain-containing protein [Paludibacter sp.]|nr:TonB-dependent receptor plug domain-containing protein [Paludibacter sp.]
MSNRVNYFIVTFLYLSSSVFGVNFNAPKNYSDSVALNEIVVQASRDNSKLHAIPASVSIISSKQIQTLGINSLTDATSTIANLFMPDYGSKLTSPIYIRGIGSRINAPSVGLYVDHVPYFEKAAFNFDFFDINRIEVLRGPQGTQYGRNTMGGIVNILTKSPIDYQGTDLNLQTGTYGTFLLNIGNYSKINTKFAWSLALNYRHNDGFFINDFLNTKVDNLDSYGARTRLVWSVNDKLSVENILSFESSKQGGYPYAVYNDSLKKPEKISYNLESGYNRNLISDALVLKYNTKSIELKSVTSYQYLSDNQFIDQDFSDKNIFFVTQLSNQNMVSQEVTVQSKNKVKYSWISGAYGFVQQFDNGTDVNRFATKTMTMKKYDHVISGGAIFHQSTLKDFILPNFNLSAGIRVDAETDLLTYLYDIKINNEIANLKDTTYNSLNSLQVLPKISMNYKVNTTNFYALVARGYKTGGFNSSFERPEDLTFKPESSWNYEIGIKTSLFNNKLFVESSLFYIDWKNQQIYQTAPSGIGSLLKNAGVSVSKGLEITLNTAKIHGFEFMVSYGFTNATFISNVMNATVNYNGNFIPYVPKNTLAIQLNKTFEIVNSNLLNRIVLNTIYKGTGEIYWNDKNSHKQDFYNLLDARISFIRRNIQVDFWGTNLTNTSYETFYFESGRKYVQMGRPLHMGVKLSVNF